MSRSRTSNRLVATVACFSLLGTWAWLVQAAQRPVQGQPLAQEQPLPLGGPRPDAATIQSWKDRKFGMFIHFGLYSIAGGTWNGKPIDKGYSEQIFANGDLPQDQYSALAQRFDPTSFDPDAIVSLAQAAGMKFIVITAKHHDGFNLFKTGQTPYNVVDATPYKKDIVKELADACARQGLAFGVYYSTIDWHHPGGNTYLPGNSNPITPSQEAFNVAQVKELLGNYGPISEIWFDMGKPTPAQSAHFARTVHELQPQTMVSGRVWNHQGDFNVMGDNSEPDVAIEEPWQTPASIFKETWGYRSWQVRSDLPNKTREHIARLVRVVSHGGNYILNIGPKGDGSVVPYEADVLKGIGDWMKINAEAIYATRPQPFDTLDFGYATLGAHTLYLFIEKLPKNGVLHLPGLVDTRLTSARILGDKDGTTLPLTVDASGGHINAARIAELHSGRFMPVVAIAVDGELHVRPAAVASRDDGTVHLTAAHAAHFLNYNGYGYEAPATIYKLRWYAALGPGRYRATIHYMPMAKPVRANIVVDGHTTTVTFPPDGKVSVMVDRDAAAEPYAMNVDLTPVEPYHAGDALPVRFTTVELSPAAERIGGEGRGSAR
ncbi:MAG: alpha-L-fucosidase [Steroidobacteraceae bacterium]